MKCDHPNCNLSPQYKIKLSKNNIDYTIIRCNKHSYYGCEYCTDKLCCYRCDMQKQLKYENENKCYCNIFVNEEKIDIFE
jgi:hypothetical protein